MKNSTFSAQVANNLLTLLQGYSKTIRLLLVMFLTLTVTTNVWGATWEKATSIAAGDVVLLVCDSKKMELSGVSTYGSGTAYSTSPAGLYELTVEAGSSSGTFSLKNGKNYLYWNSGNSLATSTSKTANSSWKITFNSGNLTILNAKDNTRKLQWNASSPRFACYTSSQTAVQLYKKVTAAPSFTVTATSNNNNYGTVSVSGTTITASPKTGYTYANPAYTVTEGSATVTQDGDIFNVNPSTDCTIRINFVEKPKYTVTFNAGSGTSTTSLTETSAGAGVTLPTPTIDCGEWSFAGWAEAAIATETTTAPATLLNAGDNYKPTEDCTLYAVYQRTEETEGNGGETEVTNELSFANTNQRTSYSTAKQVWEQNGITLTNDKSSSTSNVGDYSNPARFYKSSKITITAPGNITKIQFKCVSSYVISIDGASTSGTTVTVTLNGTSDTYIVSSLSAQVRLNSLSVTYATTSAGGTITTTYYHSTPDCGGTPEQPTYSITIDNNIQNGTVTADKSTAPEGETISLTVVPSAGYKLEAITVTKTTGETVEVDNKKFTMPASDVTVSATFTEIPKYTVSFSTGTGNSTPADISEPVGGAGITLPDGPTPDCSEEGWEFGGWSTTNIKDQTTTISELLSAGSNYKPTKNTTLYAVYSKTESAGNGGAQTTATLTNEEIAAKYVNEVTTKYGEHTIESEFGIWGGMIVIGNLENTKYIQISSDKTNRHLASPTFSANITNITIKGRHNASKTRNIYICSSNETAQPSSGDLGYGSIASSGVSNQYTDWTDVSITVSGSHTKFYVYADGGLQIHSIIVTIGGSTTTTYYHSNPCEVATTPTWEDATIDHNTIQVACGSTTQLGAAAPNGPATITFNGYDLQNSVTVTASEGFLVSTNKEKADTYKQEVTVNPHKDGQNIGKIQNVYVIADATAKTDDYTGTITLTGADITNGSQVINVTAAVTCTQYTITWSVNGDDSHQVTYSPGDALQLPEIDITPCDGMDHVGWTDNMGYVHETDILFTETTDMTVTGNQIYYAVFATSTSSDDGAETALNFSKQNYKNQQEITSLTINAVTVTFDKGTNSNAPKYYDNGTAVRVYGGGYFTVSSENIISNIIVTFSNTETAEDNSNEVSTSVGTYNNGTWTGSENSITFTVDGSSGHRRIQSIAVTSTGNASYYTDYTTTCEGRQLKTPTNLQATDITHNSATLTWDAVAGANKYKVVINGTEYISNTNSYTTHPLKSKTDYTWTVQAIGNGTTFFNSDISAEATFTTKVAVTITWIAGATKTTNPITYGQSIGEALGELPTPATPDGCKGKTFMGWTTTRKINSDGTNIEYLDAETVPTENTTYYAVFAATDIDGATDVTDVLTHTINGKESTNTTYTNFSEKSYESAAVYAGNTCNGTSEVRGVIQLRSDKSTSGIVTTKSGGSIKSITVDWNSNTAEGRTLDIYGKNTAYSEASDLYDTNTQGTKLGSIVYGTSTSLTIDGNYQYIGLRSKSSAMYLTSITIVWTSGNVTYTDYSTSCGDFLVTYYGFNTGYTTICGNPGEITVPQFDTYTIPTCTPTEDPQGLNRTFAGTWVDDKGNSYKPGDSFEVTDDITLYAQWTWNTNTIPTDDEGIGDLATTDIVVTGGNTLTLAEGTTTINSLTLKGGIQADGSYKMPIINIPDNATLKRNSDIIYLDLIVNAKNYYPFAVPFRAKNGSDKANWDYVGYIDPDLKKAATYRTHFVIKTYDGAKRAENGENRDANWVIVNRDTYLEPGIGYMITAMTAGKDTATIRIPMSVPNEWLANGEQESITVKEQKTTRNQVTVTAYTGKASDPNNGGHQRHTGWNFVANPYLSNFTGGTNPSNVEGSFINGEIIINNGEYDYGGDDVPYVTIPAYDFAHYDQVKLSDATLSPAYSFFVQVGKSGTMTFETAGRQQAPASIAARNAEERPVKMDVDITLSDNHSSDQTGIIICDRYNDAYEIGRDLEKLFGSAYNLSVYTLMADNTPLAFQALAIRSNMQVIPVGYRAPEQGEYTFRLNEATSSIDLLNEQYEQLVLVDYQTGELTNLLISDYTFYSERTQADNRFAIYAVPRQNAPTDLPNAIGQDKQAQKIIHNGHLYILRDGNVYNGNGQIVK